MSIGTLTYRAAALANLLNLTERRVQQLAKEGIIPKAKKGQYDWVSCVKNYIQYLQDRALGRTDGRYRDASDIKFERKRLIKAQADNAECEYQLRRGELVALNLVIEILNEVAVLYGSSVDALPGRLAPELAGMNDPALIKAKLFDECRHIRNLTAERLERFAIDQESRGKVREDSESPSGENTE